MQKPAKQTIRLAVAVALCALFAPPAAAQDWPTRSVRIVVPFGPGSTPDLIVRVIADELQPRLKQTFIVENKPGASGNTGTDAVAKAEPDGHTLGISIGGPLAINPLLFGKMPYDPAKDIAAVTTLVSLPSALAVTGHLGVDNVASLVALLRQSPDKYNFGSIGLGSLSHLAMEAVALKSQTKMVHIPYAGSPAAMTALVRGDVQMACLPAISVKPHADTGAVKMLAVSTPKRSPFLPNVPTLKEAGIDVEADAWNGLIAPAGTPAAVIAAINREVVAALRSEGVRAKLAAQFMEPVGDTPQAFRARIDAEVARWAPVIKAANIKVN